jgi:polysaccharide biosynthesis protein PelD
VARLGLAFNKRRGLALNDQAFNNLAARKATSLPGERGGAAPPEAPTPTALAPLSPPAVAKPIPAVAPSYGLQILPPVAALIELAVMVVGLLLVEWSLPNLDIVNLQPSPYWLPVLLLSLQYGTPSGSLAAIFAIAIYFTFGTFPEQGVGENEFTYRLRILVQPILWIAAAVLLGQFRMVQIATRQELTQRLATLENEAAVLADYSTRLRSRCDVLERTLAGRGVPQGAPLLDALASLPPPHAGSDLMAARPAIERCLAVAFPGATASVFVRRGDALELAASSGWLADAPWATTLAKGHPLYAACVETKRALTVLEAGHEPYLDHQGLAVVPIFEPVRAAQGASSDVVGILKIEQITARSLTPRLPAAMAALATTIAASLITARVEPNATAAANVALKPQNDDGRKSPDGAVGAIAVDLIRPKVMR